MSGEIQYQGVSAIPVNPQGKILLQQRDDRPDLLFPGCWKAYDEVVDLNGTPFTVRRYTYTGPIDQPAESITLFREFFAVYRDLR